MNEILMNISYTEIIVTVISLVVTWVLTQLSGYIGAVKEEKLAETENKKVQNYISIAMDTVQQVVDMLNVTMVNSMKEYAADGTLTAEEIETIKMDARQKVMLILSAEATEALQLVYGDLASLIDMWIINATEKAKKDVNGSGITSQQAVELHAAHVAQKAATATEVESTTDVETASEVIAETPIVSAIAGLTVRTGMEGELAQSY